MLNVSIIYGWYHEELSIVKFIIRRNEPDSALFIHSAWKLYNVNINKITIYYIDCLSLYKLDFDTDNNIFL